MEESVGAHYAMHIALHTLKDRCKNLQDMVTTLEKDNLHLRGQLSKNEQSSVSMSEFFKLKAQVAELTENKVQLINKMEMVTNENQKLRNKLRRLSHVNHNLVTQLSKISDSLVQYTTKSKEPQNSALIMSNTFPQDEPHTKVHHKNIEENGKICAKLEEISLNIMSGFAQDKSELDSIYSELRGMQWGDNIISESCGFQYEDSDNNLIENFNSILDELKATKQTVVNQGAALQLTLCNLSKIQETKRKSVCDCKIPEKKEMVDKNVFTGEPSESHEFSSKAKENNLPLPEFGFVNPLETTDMICPICCKIFNDGLSFQIFQEHVEKHIIDESFVLL